MQTPPVPTAQGNFSKTPFPHLLVYALERRLTGTFELGVGGASAATIVVIGGAPAKVRTSEAVHYLGDVLVDLGHLDRDHHAASLPALQEGGRLHGQILCEAGVLDDARLDAGVRTQLDRKLEHLFALPVETEFAYYDALDGLSGYGGPPTPIDPFPVLWRGIRQRPSWEHVDQTMKRIGGAAVRIGAAAQVDRFLFSRAEAAAVELLRQRTMRVVELAGTKVVGPSAAQLLVYCLVITKQVEVVETTSMRPGALRAPAAPAGPPVPPAGPTSQQLQGQAFARVQLQARSVQRQPLVVEEVVPAPSLGDGRIASPVPQPIPLPPDATSLGSTPATPATPAIAPPPPPAEAPELEQDIGALISTSIASSAPPAVEASGEQAFATPATPMTPAFAAGPVPPASASAMPAAAPSGAMRAAPDASHVTVPAAVPAAPAPSQRAIPAARPSAGAIPAAAPSAPASPRELSVEQNALKQKIVERAAGITAQNYFAMLGVDENAPVDVVQKAFISLAKVWHPDRLPGALAEVKDECSKVFSHLTEAHATLTDPARRTDYVRLLKEGGATPDEQAQVYAVLEASTLFQKAEFHLKRNDTAAALDHVKRAHGLDPEQVDYLALLTWIESQSPQFLGKEKTLEKIGVLDKALQKNPRCERAYFYRAMLWKRAEDHKRAYNDFKKASELNPRNLDAAREVRLHKMRGNGSLPPPASGGGVPSTPPKKPAPVNESLGSLFGKLFKK
jgi:tetratricopeptide (TPR) repeat protein